MVAVGMADLDSGGRLANGASRSGVREHGIEMPSACECAVLHGASIEIGESSPVWVAELAMARATFSLEESLDALAQKEPDGQPRT